MKRLRQNRFESRIGLLAGAVLCLLSAVAAAAESTTGRAGPLPANQHIGLFPLQQEQSPPGLSFDLGGSETRKLELQFDRPLTLNIGSHLQKSASGVGSVLLNSTLSLQLNDTLDITASLGAGKSQSSFQPLGSILCQNGVLDRGSFRASDCYFINQANVLKQNQVALGLRYGSNNLNAAIGMFRNEVGLDRHGAFKPAAPTANPRTAFGLLMPGQNNPLLSATNPDQSLSYLRGETSGINLEFRLGLETDDAGDVRLGLQLTRVMDASFEASSLHLPGLQTWAIASPFDSAKLSLDWSKGKFSGGIQSYYRDQVQFLNRNNLDSMATFDVQFTWRTPWNANLSVGTSNVLNTGSKEDQGKSDTRLQDPFESVYGRIPYVRYQQDL